MKQNTLELCQWMIETAKKAGADDVSVGIYKRRFIEIEYRKRKPETIKEATTQNASIRIYSNERYSSQNSSDLRKEALRDFIIKAVENTQLLEKDPYRSLPDAKYLQPRADINLEILDGTYQKYSTDQRHTLVKEVEEACLNRGGDKVISVTAGTSDHLYEETVMASNGFQGQLQATECWAGAEMSAQDEGDRRPSGWFWAGSRMRNQLPDAKEIGERAAERALKLLGSKKIQSETLPIIIENRNVSRVLSGLLSAFYGGNIQQKRSFLAEKKDKKIASELLTLEDNPLLAGGFGSNLYDGDGMASKKRTMIESGVLISFFVDWYYSRKLGWEPTTGGLSNLIIPPGQKSIAEIMKDLKRGVLITGFLGGNSNSTTGDFSVGIDGQLFEDGQQVQAISEMNIADNHLEFWNKLIAVADDPYPYSNWRTPSLVFNDVMVAGI
jgi:PmbA protein